MKQPHRLLIEAAVRLFADGHPTLATDLRQLARRWTPEDERELCGHERSVYDDLDEQEHF